MDLITKIHAYICDNNIEYDIRILDYNKVLFIDIYGKKTYEVYIFSGKVLCHKTQRHLFLFSLDDALLYIKKQYFKK